MQKITKKKIKFAIMCILAPFTPLITMHVHRWHTDLVIYFHKSLWPKTDWIIDAYAFFSAIVLLCIIAVLVIIAIEWEIFKK